jgi:hypothetical protein
LLKRKKLTAARPSQENSQGMLKPPGSHLYLLTVTAKRGFVVKVQLLAKQNHRYNQTTHNKIRVLLNFVKRAYN